MKQNFQNVTLYSICSTVEVKMSMAGLQGRTALIMDNLIADGQGLSIHHSHDNGSWTMDRPGLATSCPGRNMASQKLGGRFHEYPGQ